MPAVGTFDLGYPSSPWDGISQNQRPWYDEVLRDIFFDNTVYNRWVTNQFHLGDVAAPSMVITDLIPPHPNFDALGLRDLWMTASHVDSRQRTITFSRYGSKLAYHKYDNAITFWRQNATRGLENILRGALGRQMVEIMDNLARNAFLTNSFSIYGGGTGVDFADLTATDTLSTDIVDNIYLAMQNRSVPLANIGDSNGRSSLICLTTPGAIFDLQREVGSTDNRDFVTAVKYANPGLMFRGEVGEFANVRFIATPRAHLYNCGEIIAQSAIKVAQAEGDGTPTTNVDGVYATGQAARTPYVEVATGEAALFSVNDIVTIHTTRTAAFGVTNGVDYREGGAEVRRIVSVDTVEDRLTFDKPLMTGRTTDLGSTVFGYVTKGEHVHTAIFLGGTDGVVTGVSIPPRIHMPGPVDDFESMHRFSWDAYMGWQVFQPEVFEVAYLRGAHRVKGPIAA